MARPKLQLRIAQSPVLRYGLAVLSVSVALGGALLIERLQLRNITLFLFAIAVAAWYGGTGAAVLALVLSCISFAHFFVEPSHSIPYFILFALFAWLVSWFSSVRRRVEAELLAERTQQGSLLNLTHDSIFVRDMDFIITYWNLGAQEFERLGSGRTHRINVRLVAATHRDLAEMVKRNEFRSDLYYRLNVFPVVLPPLRERRQDIPELVSHFVGLFGRRVGKHINHIPKETLDAFTSHSWPGNVRELQNLIERAVIRSNNGVLPNPLPKSDKDAATNPVSLSDKNPVTVTPSQGTFDVSTRALILRALQVAGWIIGGPSGAAARLGLKWTTLIAKMKKLGISRPVRRVEVAGLNQKREPDRPWQPVAD